MQISKAQHDEWVSTIQTLTEQVRSERDERLHARRQTENFNEILDKIVRAATGQPINQNRDLNVANFGSGYQGNEHRCVMPGEIEVLRSDLALAQEVIIRLESQVAAAVAVAMFAKEHKA